MEAIIDHMVQRLSAAEPQSDPFPHVYVTELLPADFYWELLRSFPAETHYQDCGKRHHVKGESTRLQFPLSDRFLDGWHEPESELWRMLRDALCSLEVQQAVFHALREGLAYRYGVTEEAVRSLKGYPSPTLFRESEGYAIAPHPDTRKKMVTMQLALPDTDQQRDLGTSLYRRSITQMRKYPRGFVEAKQFPFLPNTAYAFVVLNNFGKKSWHGRAPLRHEQGVRNTLLNIYGEKPGNFPSPYGHTATAASGLS